MAKIMGLELKKIKTFMGTDGYGLNAYLYLKGKQVAFVLDEGNGGMLDISFLDNTKKEEVFRIANQYYEKYPKFMLNDTDWAKLEELVEELYALHETEKYFKQQGKKGYPIVVEVHYTKRTEDFMKTNRDFSKQDCMVAFTEWSEKAKKHLMKEYEPVEYKVYQKLEDFVIE